MTVFWGRIANSELQKQQKEEVKRAARKAAYLSGCVTLCETEKTFEMAIDTQDFITFQAPL